VRSGLSHASKKGNDWDEITEVFHVEGALLFEEISVEFAPIVPIDIVIISQMIASEKRACYYSQVSGKIMAMLDSEDECIATVAALPNASFPYFLLEKALSDDGQGVSNWGIPRKVEVLSYFSE